MSRPWQVLAGIQPPPLQADQREARRKVLLGNQESELSIEHIRQQIEDARATAKEKLRMSQVAAQTRAIRQKGGDPQAIYSELLAADPDAAEEYRKAANAESATLNPEGQQTPEFSVGAAPLSPDGPTGAIPQNLDGTAASVAPVSPEAQQRVVATPAKPATFIDMGGNAREIMRRSARQVSDQAAADYARKQQIETDQNIRQANAARTSNLVDIPPIPELNFPGMKGVSKDIADNIITALKPKTPENLNADEKAIDDLMKRKGMTYADAYRQIHPLPASATINIGAGLTDSALDAAAQVYAKTGVLPALGMNSAAAKTKIMNRAGELLNGGDIVLNKADVKANSDSLNQATKLKDALTSFENTAIKNMAILEGSAKKIVDSGSPFLNTPLRAIDEKLLGSTELPIYRAARQIVVNEVAKLTNNPNLTGQLSDSARHEIESLLPPEMTLKQLLALLPVLKQDMKNRTSSIDEQIAAIRGRISGVGGGVTTPSTGGGSSDAVRKRLGLPPKGQ